MWREIEKSGKPLLLHVNVKKHKLKNVYFDTSVNCTQFYIKSVGKKIGFDRINFKIKREYRNKILGENARKILEV